MGMDGVEGGMGWGEARLYRWVSGGEGRGYRRVQGLLGVVEVEVAMGEEGERHIDEPSSTGNIKLRGDDFCHRTRVSRVKRPQILSNMRVFSLLAGKPHQNLMGGNSSMLRMAAAHMLQRRHDTV